MKPIHRAPQDGIVLIVVLILLVIIGLSTATMTRNVLSSDLVSQNLRAEALASEAAQLALTHCEQAAITGAPVIARYNGTVTPVWSSFANWHTGSVQPPTTLTDAQLASATASFKANTLPQCMIENALAGTDPVVIVTARGFSPDYAADTSGNTTNGSVVWVQSTLRL